MSKSPLRRELSVYLGRDRMGAVVITGTGERSTYAALDLDKRKLGVFPTQTDATREILSAWLARQKALTDAR